MAHRAALGTGLLAATAILLLAPPVAAAPEHPPFAPTQAGSNDNRYEVAHGGSMTATLRELADDDLVLYESLELGPLAPSGAGTLSTTGTFPTGTFTFTATPGFAGEATAPYTGETADGDRVTANVVFVVDDAPNQAPVARPDSATVRAGGTVSVSPLDNDDDPDAGDLLVLTDISPSSRAGVTVETSGTLVRVRVAAGAATGTRRFTYTIQDRAGATASSTLTVTVTRPQPTTTTTTTTNPPSTTPSTRPGPRPTTSVPRATLPSTGTSGSDGSEPATATTVPGGGTSATTAGGDVTTTTAAGGAGGLPPSSDLGPGAGAGPGDRGRPDDAADATDRDDPTDLADADSGGSSGTDVLAGVLVAGLGVGVLAVAGRRRTRRAA